MTPRPDGAFGWSWLALRVPAATPLGDLSFLFQAREHTVEVVLLYAHLRRELGDGYSRLALHERERLRRARATAFAAPCAAPARRPAGFAFCFRDGRFAGRFHAAGFGATRT